MIRKMLVVAAAVAMPAALLAGVTGSSVASAKALPPETGTCSISGAVTFAAPGITTAGAITNKTSEKSSSEITPSGFCGVKPIKTKIPSATTECWATLPVYSKTMPVGGTLAAGAASSCDVGGTSAAGDATISATTVKTAIKDQYYYDSAGSFISGGVSSIVSALSAGVKVTNDGTSGLITVTSASSVLPGGVCGASDAGFQINGTTNFVGAGNAVIDVCLSDDAGTGTTHNFVADLLGGSATITSAIIGGDASITYSA